MTENQRPDSRWFSSGEPSAQAGECPVHTFMKHVASLSEFDLPSWIRQNYADLFANAYNLQEAKEHADRLADVIAQDPPCPQAVEDTPEDSEDTLNLLKSRFDRSLALPAKSGVWPAEWCLSYIVKASIIHADATERQVWPHYVNDTVGTMVAGAPWLDARGQRLLLESLIWCGDRVAEYFDPGVSDPGAEPDGWYKNIGFDAYAAGVVCMLSLSTLSIMRCHRNAPETVQWFMRDFERTQQATGMPLSSLDSPNRLRARNPSDRFGPDPDESDAIDEASKEQPGPQPDPIEATSALVNHVYLELLRCP